MGPLPVYGSLGKLTWRMLAMLLAGQAVIVFFGAQVARGLAVANADSRSQLLLAVGSALALLCLLAAALMRRPVGVTLGWLVQVLTWASSVVLPAMLGVGLIFTALWVLLLVHGQRADRIVAAREAGDDGRTDG